MFGEPRLTFTTLVISRGDDPPYHQAAGHAR
jgi:hypothetical protein